MRVMVTGASGFVGGHVVDALTAAGHDVLMTDVLPPRWHPGLMFQECDVAEDPDRLVTLMDGVQVVMHLAAVSNTQAALANPPMATKITCLGTANVLEAAKTVGVERVVIAGSTLVSGLLVPHKMEWPAEHYDEHGDLDEQLAHWVTDEKSHAIVTMSSHPYVTTKLFEEMLAYDYATKFDVPVTVLRYGIMYGERMTPGVVTHTFIERALRKWPLVIEGDGQQWRQYLYVKDLANAHVKVLDHWEESEGLYNIVAHRKVTIADIAEAVCQAVPGTKVQYGDQRVGDVPVRFCVASRAKEYLDWSATTTLEDGVAKTVEWYRRHQASGVPRRRR